MLALCVVLSPYNRSAVIAAGFLHTYHLLLILFLVSVHGFTCYRVVH